MKKSLIFLLLCFCCSMSMQAGEKSRIKVACIGNSITYGACIENRFQHGYPGILQQMLGEDYDVRNFGVGATVMLKKGDKPYMFEYAYKRVKEFMPDIVTIKLGTNDSKPYNWQYKKEFDDDMEEMIEELSALPSSPKIYLCLPVPAFEGNYKISDSTITYGVIPAIRKVAKKKKLEIIDLNTPLQDHRNLFPDRIHPTKEGAKIIASTIYRTLKGEDAPDCNLEQAFPGKKSEWNGYDRFDFLFNGRHATVVAPHEAAPGKPWIWRPAFFGAFPAVDIDLLGKGFHVAYYDLTHLYGSRRAVNLGMEFYNEMIADYGFSSKVTLEGLSRGGYFALNWAAAHPQNVACVYVDAPVCDITSWPGRKSEKLWNDFLKEWKLEDEDVKDDFRGNAMQLLGKLYRGNVPIIGVCGDADKTVPYQDNFKPFREAYQAMGGIVELILKPGVDHHPHSLEDPEPIVDFILRYQPGFTDRQHITNRSGLTNAFAKFIKEKKGCVAFFGGSITEMKGWKDQVEEDLRQRFPETEFQFIEAGIGSTGSVPHAFRMEHDVFGQGIPDLMFIEAAVNDDTNIPDNADQQIRGMEGVIRHALTVNPKMDIVMMHFMWDGFIKRLEKDIIPDVVMNHERVANHYSVTSIDLAHEISERMGNGEFNWKTFGGTHPSWFGHKFYTAAINRVFDRSSRPAEELVAGDHEIPSRPLDRYSYFPGHFLDITKAKKLKGFSVSECWTPEVKKSTRKGFVQVPMLVGLKGGASFELEFNGRAIGYFGVCGPQSGVLEYSIDGVPYPKLNTITRWSRFLYIPWVHMLADELEDGKHILKVRIAPGEKTACHIRNFLILGE